MQIAAQDVGRMSRILAGCAGGTVAALGILALFGSHASVARFTLTSSPAAALLAAGLALSLLAPIRVAPPVRVLQSMNEAVIVLDANHRVLDVNRRWST